MISETSLKIYTHSVGNCHSCMRLFRNAYPNIWLPSRGRYKSKSKASEGVIYTPNDIQFFCTGRAWGGWNKSIHFPFAITPRRSLLSSHRFFNYFSFTGAFRSPNPSLSSIFEDLPSNVDLSQKNTTCRRQIRTFSSGAGEYLCGSQTERESSRDFGHSYLINHVFDESKPWTHIGNVARD